MNSIKTSPRGFPFDELTLKELQDQTQPFIDALGGLVPDNSRLVGVEVFAAVVQNQDGSFSLSPHYTDGLIRWNGELLPFKGGASHDQFSIMEEVQDRTFNVGTETDPQLEDHPAYVRRWAEIGNIAGAESVHFMSFLNPAPRFLTYLQKGTVFLGTAVPVIATTGGYSSMLINVEFGEALDSGNYMVFSSFYRTDASSQADFDFDVFDRQPGGFKLRLRNITEPVGNLMYQYLIIPSNNQFVVSVEP